MKLTDYIPEILTMISGGALVQFFNFWQSKKTEGRNDFEALIEKYKEDNDRLREKEAKLEERLDHIEKELQQCRMKLQLMESAHYDLPIPAWLKDINGVMLSFNKPYEELFIEPLGKTSSDYIGKTDIEFWGEGIGKEYLKNDQKILRGCKSELVTETVLLPDGSTTKWMILKYVRYAGTTKIGVAGIAFKELDENAV